MDEKIDMMDRISNLPEFILHHILSFLPRKEASKTCLLSKEWNCVWSSFPILDFDQDEFVKPDMCYPYGHIDFMKSMHKSLRRFTERDLQMQKFKLHTTLVNFRLTALVDKGIGWAFEHEAKEISLRVQTVNNSFYTLPRTIFVAKSTNGGKLEQPYTCSAVKFFFLQKLWLEQICVNEEIIQEIIRTCPFITDFGIVRCQGFKTLDISKLSKLSRVEVASLEQEVDSIKVEAANIQHFRFIKSHQRLLDITACQNLKELYLRDLSITDQYLNFNIFRFPHLETLHVIGCNMLKRVKISAQRLRMLKINACQKLEELEIDSPNLSSFLNELLEMSNQRKVLNLTITIWEEVTFNLEDLEVLKRVTLTLPSSFQLEVMMIDVRCSSLSMDYGSLVEGLLSSFRPKKLLLPTDWDSQK
ncbi:F-box protein At5g03100 [Quercus suber]|uniref:F-box protein At5g03100 n=1 Tax=Quercus suber TaxID=58331 RepID=UPI0032DE3081